MHPALHTPEILLSIVAQLESTQLVTAACVSHNWSSWAVERIWRDSLVPFDALLAVLAPLKRTLKARSEFTSLEASAETIPPEKVARFDHFAKKITGVELNVLLTPPSIQLLRDLIGTPETPLLPRLSRLVLTADGHLFVRQTAALLLSPSISSLHIRSGSYKYWGPETLINTFWEEIQAQSSNVKCLNVKSTATAPSYDSFTNLVSLHQTNVAMHPTVWKEFESCPHLEFVSINGPFVDYAPAPRRPPVVTLESVRQVDLGNSFSINHTVDLQMPGLRSLKMQASRRFLETVGRSSRSVEFVQLTFPSTLGFSDLQPLTAFRKLHTLHLGYRNPARTSVNLTDEDIQSFASNMGHLENFSMYPVDPPSADTECRLRLTASSLASFAAHCKSLNTLKIVFCASRMEDLSSMPAFSSLRSLQLACVCVAPGLEAQLGRILAEKCPRGVELKVLSAPLHEVHPACKGEDDGTRCRRVEESFRAFF